MMKRTRRLGIAALAAATLAACGGGDTATSEQRPAMSATTTTEVALRSFEFVPVELDVAAGTTVTWKNEDDILHTATSGTVGEQGVPGVSEDTPPKPDGLFDVQLDGRGSTGTFTFSESGTFAYFCEIHSGMAGTIRVG